MTILLRYRKFFKPLHLFSDRLDRPEISNEGFKRISQYFLEKLSENEKLSIKY